jgi:hypothetical protein
VVYSLSQKGGWTPPADPPDNIFVTAGEVYPLFCEELQTLWFAAVLHQIFFRGIGEYLGGTAAGDEKIGGKSYIGGKI